MIRNLFNTLKKILLISLLFSLTFCDSPQYDSEIDELMDKYGEQVLLALYIKKLSEDNSFDTHWCTNNPNFIRNRTYLKSDYYPSFINNNTQYQNILIGDSTIDISDGYTNYLNPAVTQSVAVGGNKLCDMIIQMKAINTNDPDNVIISTAGGNDLLSQYLTNDEIVAQARELIDKVRDSFPDATIVMIGVHPTQVEYANANKGYTNQNIQNYLGSLPNTCWVNPLALFGVGEGESANESDMLDIVHYNEAMSFNIKDEIQSECGVSF